MPEPIVPGGFPLLAACAACGSIDDLVLVLSSSFGLTVLLALGQYAWDRARRTLGHRRPTPDVVEGAICAIDPVVESDAGSATSTAGSTGPPAR